jgi:hypothetical protein
MIIVSFFFKQQFFFSTPKAHFETVLIFFCRNFFFYLLSWVVLPNKLVLARMRNKFVFMQQLWIFFLILQNLLLPYYYYYITLGEMMMMINNRLFNNIINCFFCVAIVCSTYMDMILWYCTIYEWLARDEFGIWWKKKICFFSIFRFPGKIITIHKLLLCWFE